MKKVFALILALCLLACMLPMSVMAEATAVKVRFNATAADFTLTAEPGTTTYVISDDAKQFIQWAEADAPTDKFVKVELSEDGATLNVTMKNIDIDSTSAAYTSHAIEFTEGDYAVVLTLEGENKMQERNSACIKNNNAGGMTITGEGKLTLAIGTADETGSASGAIWANGGDLTIKNTNLDVTVNSPSSSKHHVVYSSKGSAALEGSKMNITTQGGQLVFTGTGEAKIGRYTLDTAEDRFITIKDCDIVINCKTTALASATAATISNTSLKVTKSSTSGDMFIPAPVLEGEYTAIAGLAKNAEKPEKLKEYSEKKLGSYTYFYMVPGIVNLLPTEPTTEATEAPTIAPTEPTVETTVPEVTEPVVTTPATTEATTPATTEATTPATTEATTPATDANDVDDTNSGNSMKTVLIVMVVLVVVAAAAVGALVIIRKKKA